MEHHKLSVRFILRRSKKNKQGHCPILCRLTYKNARKSFSAGLMVKPKYWNSKQQRLNKDSEHHISYNRALKVLYGKIYNAYLELEVSGRDFVTEDIYRRYRGEKQLDQVGVLEYYRSYLKKYEALIGIEIKQGTWNKFKYIYEDLKAFIKHHSRKQDVVLSRLTLKFINDFEYYYKVTRKLKQITINKKLQRLKKIVKEALADGYLKKNPFLPHKAKRVSKEVIFLSTEELKTLEEHAFKQPRLQMVKDLFVFSCYTGLAYKEIANLRKEHIIEGFDKNKWITMKRQKTAKVISVPLLPKALEIISEYDFTDARVLPKISNQKYNSYLKEIADILGIQKRMTTHMARRTFASTVLLYNDVPIEIVSELLGHSSIKITQESYGKVVQRKISLEMERLKNIDNGF